MSVRILQGDCLAMLGTLPDASVQCCVTSPPYYGLRDYGVAGQIGLEATPDAFVAKMVEVFREIRRVLRDDGTCWVNMGDSYSSGARTTQCDPSGYTGTATLADGGARRAPPGIAKPKDLLMMPARVALALQANGWWLRSDIIWHKPNPMPESVTDRPTSAHEHVFLLTKAQRYFFDADAVREPHSRNWWTETPSQPGNPDRNDGGGRQASNESSGRNMRNVWTIATAPYSEAHFATFPPEIPERCIKAGTSERGCCPQCAAPWVRQVERSVSLESGSGRSGNKPTGKGAGGAQTDSGTYDIRMGPVVSTITTGWAASCQCNAGAPVPCVVLDPFAGAFTTCLVADRLQRHSIGIELNPKYVEMARRRIEKDAGMFAEVA